MENNRNGSKSASLHEEFFVGWPGLAWLCGGRTNCSLFCLPACNRNRNNSLLVVLCGVKIELFMAGVYLFLIYLIMKVVSKIEFCKLFVVVFGFTLQVIQAILNRLDLLGITFQFAGKFRV